MKHLTLLCFIAIALTLNNFSNALNTSKNLKLAKSSKSKAFKGNLKDCTVKKISDYEIKAYCLIQGSDEKQFSWIDFDYCFQNDGGQIVHKSFDR